MSGSDAISPTAHYTGYVWARNGLSHPGLVTAQGRLCYRALAPVMRASRALSGPSLEAYLLARHQALDAGLQTAITEHGITQVIEVAAVTGGFDAGRFLSDLHLGGSPPLEVRVGRRLLSAFVRGGVYLHFPDRAHAEAALRDAGFATAHVAPAPPAREGGETAHILEASTTDRGRR